MSSSRTAAACAQSVRPASLTLLRKHVLGIWVQAAEGAKFWAGVCAELANRGVKDVLIVCCDGLTGFPEAIEAT